VPHHPKVTVSANISDAAPGLAIGRKSLWQRCAAGGRPWETETLDPANARLPVDADGLCHDQGLRGVQEGQFAPWIDAICGGTEVHFINRLFGLYA
jgi:hypothetical protein